MLPKEIIKKIKDMHFTHTDTHVKDKYLSFQSLHKLLPILFAINKNSVIWNKSWNKHLCHFLSH